MPAWNSRETIGRALDSVLRQSLPPFEVIVVDDGSSDGTSAFVEQTYGQRVRVIRQPNAGPSRARNRAVEEARGDWVAFLDSDDEWMPEKLERQTEFLRQHPGAGLCATSCLLTFDDGHSEQVRVPQDLSRQEVFVRLSLKTVFPLSTVVMPRAVFTAMGGFDESLRCGEDRYLWTRVAVRHETAVLDELLTRRHSRLDSLSEDPEKTLRDGLEANRLVIGLLAREGAIPREGPVLRHANMSVHHSVARIHARRKQRPEALAAWWNGVMANPLGSPAEWKKHLSVLLTILR
jgi:glycosyltransferase involved in cell wall biosynthesis